METKNTPENKAAFFLQYFGQEVLCYHGNVILENLLVTNSGRTLGLPQQYLSLKSLSDISDEDAIEVAKLNIKPTWVNGPGENDYEYCIHCKMTSNQIGDRYRGRPSKIFSIRSLTNQRDVADYLRSRSYLVSFRNITTEEILQFGWAKIQPAE